MIRPLQEQVKAQDLWACHLGPDLGGKGYGQLKLGADERDPRPVELGADACSAARRPTPATPRSSPTTAPTSRRRSTSQPLLDGEIVSCFSMTEPQAGSDPAQFTCRAERDGDEWVINGEKWFSSNLRYAAFAIVMAVTDPDVSGVPGHVDVPRADRHARASRSSATSGSRARRAGEGSHAYVRYDDVRVPATTCSAARARRS